MRTNITPTTNTTRMDRKIKIENHTASGGLWIAAWLFTIGFLKLSFWQGVLAILLWPYYLGVALRPWLVGPSNPFLQ